MGAKAFNASTASKSKRSRLDGLVLVALAVGGLLTLIDVVWTFTLAPLVQGAQLSAPVIIAGQQVTTKLLLSQKIFYLHVPVAVASFAAMLVAAVHAIVFLARKRRESDLRSRTAMQVTLVFVLATMVSGDLWTRFEWGVWWVWEPRLTTYFILMLLVIAYFILRNAIDDPERRARFSAVFCLVAFIDAPISFLITRLVPSSIHPVVFRTDSGLPPMMLIPFLMGLFGMLLVCFAVYRLAVRVNEASEQVEELKEQLEEREAAAQHAAAEDALERLQAQGAAVVGDAESAVSGDGSGHAGAFVAAGDSAGDSASTDMLVDGSARAAVDGAPAAPSAGSACAAGDGPASADVTSDAAAPAPNDAPNPSSKED